MKHLLLAGILCTLLLLNVSIVAAAKVADPPLNPVIEKAMIEHKVMKMNNITNEKRFAASEVAKAKGLKVVGTVKGPDAKGVVAGAFAAPAAPLVLAQPGGIPDYFGASPNYALSQLPVVVNGTVTPGTGIRKFVDTLPGLGTGGMNNLGQFIPVAVPDMVSYPLNGSTPAADYYEIASVEWTEKMHSDIPPSTVRGYVQLETPVMNIANGSQHIPLYYLDGITPIKDGNGLQVFAYEKPHFLGPLIIAQKDKPVRIKYHNYLKVGGNLSVPVDTELMGCGLGPLGPAGGIYSQQRAAIHLHGGNTPWISDGTQHQWTVPANESTSYPTGVSVAYVPDMDNGIEPIGTMTFYYTNQQSARLMFYHEHAMGVTRLGVMAGEAAGYLVTDPAEAALVALGAIPTTQIPLVIIDRTYVPDAAQMTAQDPTWNWGGNVTSPWPHTGDFWMPHVYMPAMDATGQPTAMGRWDYGPWTFPPLSSALHPPVANPYYDPTNAPWEPALIPGVPTVSQVPETFLDTPVINGAAYPKLTLGPHAYRFRILNAANERFFNLQFYYAASNGTMWNGQVLLDGNAGEVPMVPAVPTAGFPASWPVDGRPEGVPAPNASGPSWIQIGTEGGFLPNPVVIPPQPVSWDTVFRSSAVTNVQNKSLLIGPAERADVIVDFTGIPNGTKLILYNDAPAPLPGPDSRYDFFTGDPDQTLIGGAPTTQAGYGPNTRTLMQIEILSSVPQVGPAFSMAALNTNLPGAYAQIQDAPLVPQSAYNAAFNAAYTNQYLGIPNTTMTFLPAGQATPVTMQIMPKSVMEGFDPEFGRITAQFGVEVQAVPGQILEQGIGYFNNDPETEVFANTVPGTLIGTTADGTQIWKITHNGVDSHIVHVHMYNLQVINRVYWDGTILPPEPNEVGWKESVQIHPLQDLVVAMRPIAPNIPWELPNSIRTLNAVTADGSSKPMEFTGLDPQGNQINVVNHVVNFGWEYVWHCHLLGHEENDMMRSQSVAVAPAFAPGTLTAVSGGANRVNLSWTDTTVSETDWTIQRATAAGGPWSNLAQILSTTGPQKGGNVQYSDPTAVSPFFYRVLATNVVGDRTVYAGSSGYPTVTVNSTPSNVASAAPVGGLPVAVITRNVSTGRAPLTVNFGDRSTGIGINQRNWSFGDGTWFNTTVATPQVIHVFTLPGVYNVRLTVCNASGCNTTIPGTTITVNPPVGAPVAKFAKNVTSGTAPLSVKFTDQSTGTTLNKWNWSFGDGTWFNTTVAAQKSPIHVYPAAGVYTVQLTVCNANGCNTTVPGQTVTVNAPGAPVAKFAKNVTTGIAPLSVQFTDQSTGTGLNKWNWSFGDGTWFNTTVAAQKSPIHVYPAAGVYIVQLTVSNAAGSNTTVPGQTVTVTSLGTPVAVIVKNVSSGVIPLSVNFGDRSTGTGINRRNWSFGDGTWFNTTGVMPQIIHTFTAKGTYNVRLTVCNGAGCNTTIPGTNITAR